MTVEEYESLKTCKPFEFRCRNCGILVLTKKRMGKIRQEKQKRFLCRNCATKQTCLEKYGVDNPGKFNEIKKKREQTNLERYGVINVFQSEEIKKKIRETCLEVYGSDNPSQNEKVQEKIKKTCLEKYGTEYGFQNEDVKKKIKETCLERYGVEYPAQSEGIKEKIKQTNLERYGVSRYAQTLEYHKTKKHKYELDELQFDSLWELKFYLFHKEKGSEIIYHPCYFEYSYNGESHKYFPDFQVNNELVEIKGDHLKDENGNWICPFDRSLDELFESKRQCAIENNVKILYGNDLKNLGII